jgi:hypothetical protein
VQAARRPIPADRISRQPDSLQGGRRTRRAVLQAVSIWPSQRAHRDFMPLGLHGRTPGVTGSAAHALGGRRGTPLSNERSPHPAWLRSRRPQRRAMTGCRAGVPPGPRARPVRREPRMAASSSPRHGQATSSGPTSTAGTARSSYRSRPMAPCSGRTTGASLCMARTRRRHTAQRLLLRPAGPGRSGELQRLRVPRARYAGRPAAPGSAGQAAARWDSAMSRSARRTRQGPRTAPIGTARAGEGPQEAGT